MEDKKKNDIATKPLNAGQRVAARGVLCGALADGSSVMDWLSGTPNQYLLDGHVTPAGWWKAFKDWHQRPRRVGGDPNADMRIGIEWACACALMCAVGAPELPGLDDDEESAKWLAAADRLVEELREREERDDGKTALPADARKLAVTRKQVKAIQRIIGILNEFENESGGDWHECHRLQSGVIIIIKTIYRVED